MKPQTLLPLAATALSLLPTASAWTFTWRDANGKASLQNNNKPQPCTQINQAKDAQFDFHPESDPYNFYIWANNNCSGDPQGYSPILWRHNASRDLHSYLIDYGDKSGPVSSATASTATTATTAGSAGTSATSSAATTTSTDGAGGGGGGGGGLGGGAIAGIVIGVVAAIAILGALFFFLGRRKRQNAAAAEAATRPAPPAPVDQLQGGPGGGGATAPGHTQEYFAEKKDGFADKGPIELPSGNQVSEMSNSHAVVEMSNSHSVVEMSSDSQQLNELEAPYRGPQH